MSKGTQQSLSQDWERGFKQIAEALQKTGRTKERADGPGQLCRLVMCNYVKPTSACGSTQIVAYRALFLNSDGSSFDTDTARLTLNYPQCTSITNRDPNVCVIKVRF